MFGRLRRWLLLLVIAIPAALLLAGMAATASFWWLPETQIEILRIAPLPALKRPTLEAGVAVRDITPAIGLPKLGYAAWSGKADGFRTRLQARAFCLKPATGLPVAIVQADLGASSLLLQRRVAERVALSTDLPVQNLAILATRTHSGPAGFLDSDFDNAFGGSLTGFDPALYEFLATRIAEAVTEACTTRRPARIGIGQTSVWGLTRNRSLDAWLENHDVTDKHAGAERALQAVNPVLTMIRIDLRADDGKYLPAGAISSFAIQGAGIPAFRGPYHADVWATFEQEIEWAIHTRYPTPWPIAHAAFGSAQGDTQPNWRAGRRGDDETRRIGKELATIAAHVYNALDGKMSNQLPIQGGMREIDLLKAPAAQRFPLCERAIVGAAVVGGARGDEVFPVSSLPYFRADWPRTRLTGGCQAEKQWLFSQWQPLLIAPDRFPHRATIQILRIGDIALLALPWDITAEAGNRIAARTTAAFHDQGAAMRVIVAGNANGYFGYATTPEEYRRQFYEGGHTLYGPGTSEFLARQAAQLATELATQQTVADLPARWHFPLATRSHWPEPAMPGSTRKLLSGPVFVPGDNETEPHWSVVYRDVAPGGMAIDQPLLAIEAQRQADAWVPLANNGRPVNDQWQHDLQLRWLGNGRDGMARYELRWNNPPATPNFRFRFSVQPRAGLPAWQSPAFPR